MSCKFLTCSTFYCLVTASEIYGIYVYMYIYMNVTYRVSLSRSANTTLQYLVALPTHRYSTSV